MSSKSALFVALFVGLFPCAQAASPLLDETFSGGIRAWTVESGQALAGRENGGTLILRSLKGKEGEPHPGMAALTATGLQPNHDYELQVSFRFEKKLPDKWPWAQISVWDSTAKLSDGNTATGLIADKRILTQLKSGDAVPDDTWRTLSLPFNTGDASSVVIRLSNNPKMYDQTHWDDIRIVPLPSP